DLLGRLLLLAAVGAAALREEEILLAVATDRRVEFGELLRLHHRGPVIVASSPRDPAAMSALAEVSATGRADAVASLGSARDAVRAVSRGGTVCLSGQPTEAPTVTELVQREVRLVGASDLPATLARVGRRDVESVLGAGARNRGSPRTQHHQGGPTGAQQERQEGVDMGRLADGTWAEEWIPPTFTVDRNGKVVGYVNDRTPNN